MRWWNKEIAFLSFTKSPWWRFAVWAIALAIIVYCVTDYFVRRYDPNRILLSVPESNSSYVPSDIPESHFNPPPPPAGGIDAFMEGIANEGITDEVVGVARVNKYMLTYYPLVALEDDVVSQLDDKQRAEYKRQNDALDKEVFGSDYKKVESLLRVPIIVLNIFSNASKAD